MSDAATVQHADDDAVADVATASAASADEFDWDSYLEEVGGQPAPEHCFYQSPEIPENKFQIGKKVQVADPRGGPELICIGTIVHVHSVWVCVQLDGTDNTHKQWLMCDDKTLQPILEETKSMLNPPVGFLHGLNTFHRWRDQVLQPRDGSSVLCPREYFAAIEDKYRPTKNLFEAGMRLEAVDDKSYPCRPQPASIAAVDKDYITINFDGWSNAYDIRVPYTSRNLFPVKWSQKAGIQLTKPAKHETKKRRSYVRNPKPKEAESPTVSSTTSSASASPSVADVLKLSRKRRSGAPRRRSRSPSTPPPSLKKAVKRPPSLGDSRLNPVTAKLHLPPDPTRRAPLPAIQLEKRARMEEAAKAATHAIPHKTPPTPPKTVDTPKTAVTPTARTERVEKVEKMDIPSSTSPTQAQPPAASLPEKEVKVETKPAAAVSAMASSAPPRAPVAAVPANQAQHPGPPVGDTLLRCGDDVPIEDIRMTVYVNATCDCGSHLRKEQLQRGPRQIGPGNLHHVTKEATQLLINAANNPEYVFARVVAGSKRFISVTASVGRQTSVRYLPIVRTSRHAWAYLKKLVDKLDVCPNLLSETAEPCPRCPRSEDDDKEVVTSSQGRRRLRRRSQPPDNGNDSDASDNTTSSVNQRAATQWSVERVAEELAAFCDRGIVDKFIAEQIDGRALLLLRTELLTQHLQLPFGPALKISDFIDSLRQRRGAPNGEPSL